MTDQTHTKSEVPTFQLLQWKHAIKLEGKGLKHSSGRSVCAHAKRVLDIKGSRDKVVAEIQTILDARKPST